MVTLNITTVIMASMLQKALVNLGHTMNKQFLLITSPNPCQKLNIENPRGTSPPPLFPPLLTRKISLNHEMPVALASIHYKRNDAKFSRGSAPSSSLNAIVRSNLPAILSHKFKVAKNKARIFQGEFFICCRITETLTEVEPIFPHFPDCIAILCHSRI